MSKHVLGFPYPSSAPPLEFRLSPIDYEPRIAMQRISKNAHMGALSILIRCLIW